MSNQTGKRTSRRFGLGGWFFLGAIVMKYLIWKTAESPRWHLAIGKFRLQWWPRECWIRKLEAGWW